MKKQEEIMWAVIGECGLYTDIALTRKEMKRKHLQAFGWHEWKEAHDRGHRCIKVRISPFGVRESQIWKEL